MNIEDGLTSLEAKKRLSIYGQNIFSKVKKSAFHVLIRQLASPLVYLLIIAALISLFLSSTTDAITILVILVINTTLGFFQEYRSERYIQKLQDFIKKTAKVRRDGQIITVLESEIVPGDVVVLEEGKVVPADGQFLICRNVLIDESVMTGESLGVNKDINDKVIAGSIMAHGYGEFLVTKTGSKTELGKIANLTLNAHKVSKFEKSIGQMSNFLMKVTLIVVVFFFFLNLLLKGFKVDNFIEVLLFSVALIISMVPEALPVIATLTLSRGAYKLAKKKVVVKRLSSVEDLGNIEVLCTDKTGTITQNSLTVTDVVSANKEKLFKYVSCCLENDNPLDIAIKKIIPRKSAQLAQKISLVERMPFDPTLRRRWIIIKEGSKKILLVLGSAEEVAKLSRSTDSKILTDEITQVENSGLRVLGLGWKLVDKNFSLKGKYNDSNLNYLGYFTILDPIRQTAKDTINQAEKLQVQIKIITGDSLGVTKNIAKSIGLIKSDNVCFTGLELSRMSSVKFDEACRKGVVFARITPEQKYQIINKLKTHYVVGYQGDGINDGPALKAANVGIAVSGAAEVAQEAADIVLLDKNLKVIIEGIQQGRMIFKNIDKYIKHTLVSNWGNFFAVALVSLFTNFVPLLPIQVLLTSISSDLPMLSVSSDNVDRQNLLKPAKYNVVELIKLPLILGLVTGALEILFFLIFKNQPLASLRTVWFIFINLTSLVVIFSVRKNGWLWDGSSPSWLMTSLILLTVILTLVSPYSFLAHDFHLEKIGFDLNLLIVVLTIIYLLFLDVIKVLYFRFNPHLSD